MVNQGLTGVYFVVDFQPTASATPIVMWLFHASSPMINYICQPEPHCWLTPLTPLLPPKGRGASTELPRSICFLRRRSLDVLMLLYDIHFAALAGREDRAPESRHSESCEAAGLDCSGGNREVVKRPRRVQQK